MPKNNGRNRRAWRKARADEREQDTLRLMREQNISRTEAQYAAKASRKIRETAKGERLPKPDTD